MKAIAEEQPVFIKARRCLTRNPIDIELIQLAGNILRILSQFAFNASTGLSVTAGGLRYANSNLCVGGLCISFTAILLSQLGNERREIAWRKPRLAERHDIRNGSIYCLPGRSAGDLHPSGDPVLQCVDGCRLCFSVMDKRLRKSSG